MGGWFVLFVCAVRIADSSSGLAIVGEHNTEKSNSDLEGINIYNQNLGKIPQGIDAFFQT